MSHVNFIKMFELVIAASLVNNFVFTRFLGLGVFFSAPKKLSTSAGIGLTFIIAMLVNAALCWAVFTLIMLPANFAFLKIVAFISVVFLTIQGTGSILKKIAPAFFSNAGACLGLLAGNCIIMAVPLISVDKHYAFFETLAFGLGSGLGFALALVIMGSLREKLAMSDPPRPFQGLPIAFMVAGMIALVFTGLAGIVRP
jgi:Na+-translocating ferredoxin:NAD+ oxidoreductase subunit A